jgi:hypothetical protein
MISESWYWRESLSKHAKMLNDKLSQKIWREESFLKVEQSVMLSCYIVRKLAESKKIPDATFQQPVELRAFKATGKTVDLLNRHRVDDLYDVENGQSIIKPLSYVSNQLIHSFVFIPLLEAPGKFYGFAFNSDRSKSKELYMIKLSALVNVFSSCAGSVIHKATYFRLENGELKVINESDV